LWLKIKTYQSKISTFIPQQIVAWKTLVK
jgi:hypothetical protein